MLFKKKISAVHVPHCKSTQDKPSLRVPLPDSVTIPMKMHSGSPAVPVVNAGDHVYIGTMIAKPGEGRVSSPVHASVSGTVTKVDVKSISIKSDGKEKRIPLFRLPFSKHSMIFSPGASTPVLWDSAAPRTRSMESGRP